MIGPLFTYLVETLELLDRVDRLLTAGARLAHLYLLFLLGYVLGRAILFAPPRSPPLTCRLPIRAGTRTRSSSVPRFSRHRLRGHARTAYDARHTHTHTRARALVCTRRTHAHTQRETADLGITRA